MAVAVTGLSSVLSLSSGPIATSSEGNKRKDVANVIISPIDIIQPKSITGLIGVLTLQASETYHQVNIHRHSQDEHQ